ncbi:hypothetical protein, conserved [Eimeria acervulina]|uniref:Transmembrane protein n=1 Tax=Eimeria acervulina TaxID=5801 RepID=U6GWC2_EIMAC|nr:hypothetical protein, conserved [Eimeria acervulina]CDI83543.1 hypothetical protein, conserved [Eimeria acervulina]
MELQEGASNISKAKEASDNRESRKRASRTGRTARTRPPSVPKRKVRQAGTGVASEAMQGAAAAAATRGATASGATGATAAGKAPRTPVGGTTSTSTAPDAKEDERMTEGVAESALETGSKEAANDSLLESPPSLKPSSNPNSKRRAIIWRAAFVAVLLAVVLMGFRRLLRPRLPVRIGPALTSNAKEVQMYEKAVRQATGELKRLWNRVSPEVRQSFYVHYSPKVYGSSSLTSPVELYERQVKKVCENERPPSGASAQEYGQYAYRLQVTRVVLKAAFARLSQLQTFEEFLLSTRGSEEDRYSVQPPVLPGVGLNSSDEELLSFRDFLDLLGSHRAAFPVFPDATARKPAVPIALAQGLARAVQTADFQTEMDAKVHRAFHELLLVTGTSLPCGSLQPLEEFAKQGPLFVEPQRPFFPVSFFSHLLAAFGRERSYQTLTDDALSTWAYQWTYEGASQRLAEIGERMRSSATLAAAVKVALVSRWALQQPHDPTASTDLVCLAFSLL